MKIVLVFLSLFNGVLHLSAQNIDTLIFRSEVFKKERTIYVQTPPDFKYASENLKFPVLYILDGQHDWFVQPCIQLIKALQQTKEIPQLLIVVIPLEDRIIECNVDSLNGPILPLHTFITKEIPEKLKAYRAGEYNALVGHSFSASFALYSLNRSPEFYDAIFANSPLDALDLLVSELSKQPKSVLDKIYYSVGGADQSKDGYHFAAYQKVRQKNAVFFNLIHVLEAANSSHNAVPIAAMPSFLSECFRPFHNRYAEIAKVDMNYKLLNEPSKIENEISLILQASKLGNMNYPPEIADYNGIASRYLNSEFYEHALGVYLQAMKDYPNYYEFPAFAAELSMSTKPEAARILILRAIELLKKFENDLPEKNEFIEELNALLKKE